MGIVRTRSGYRWSTITLVAMTLVLAGAIVSSGASWRSDCNCSGESPSTGYSYNKFQIAGDGSVQSSEVGNPPGLVVDLERVGSSGNTYSYSNGSSSWDIYRIYEKSGQTAPDIHTNPSQSGTFDTASDISHITFCLMLSDELELDLDPVDALCQGTANGSINLFVSGGTPPYSYSWSNGATTQDISGLLAGTYTVTVTDNGGLEETASATVNEPPGLLLDLNPTDALCNGAANGSIDLTISGGTGPYTCSWSDGATTEDISELVADTYTVTVTDANGCQASDSATVSEPSAMSLILEPTDALCNGAANGSIDLTISGGTGPYTCSWSDGATTEDISELVADTYTVTVTDANGCQATDSATVSEPSALSLDLVPTDALCNGAANGSIDLTISDGTGPYTCSWSNGAATEDISGLVADTYTVTVTDANGCQASDSATVDEPSALALDLLPTDALCNGAANGSIDLTISGGTGPYTCSWSNGAATEDISGLVADTYAVTVTDANGCQASDSATVEEPSALSLDLVPADALCNGAANGSIDLTISGGTGPYTSSWSNGAMTEDISGLVADTYTVTVTDANGCQASDSATVSEPSALSLDLVPTDALCNGAANGSIDLTISGGTGPYTCSWSNGATTEDISGLAADTYTVTVTDANGCQASDSATVGEPSALSLALVPTDALCDGAANGSIDLTISGGTGPYACSWSNGATTEDISGVVADTYTVTVTDANGCQASDSATVDEPSALSLSLDPTDALCNGAATGSIDLTISGGRGPYTCSWSNGATTEDISGLVAATYTVTVTDANGCQASDSATVNEPSSLSLDLDPTDALCRDAANGSIDLSISGGTPPYSYRWSNGRSTQDVAGLRNGTYSVSVTDANGCQATGSVEIGVRNSLPEAQDLAIGSVCAVGTGETNADETVSFQLTVADADITAAAGQESIRFLSDALVVAHGSVYGNLNDVRYRPGFASVTLHYTPPAGFVGIDVIEFVAEDGCGNRTSGEVIIDVVDCAIGGGGTVEVRINEVAWSGTLSDPEHEWIELYATQGVFDLTDWVLAWRPRQTELPIEVINSYSEFVRLTPEDERVEIVLRGIVHGGDHFLLERYVERVVSDMDSDFVYGDETPYEPESFRLSDDLGNELYLFDPDGTLWSTSNTDYELREPGDAPWPTTIGAQPIHAPFSMERRQLFETDRALRWPHDIDEEWVNNKGVIIFGLDADQEPLTATADHINEADLLYELMRNPPLVQELDASRAHLLSFALHDDYGDGQPLPRITLLSLDPEAVDDRDEYIDWSQYLDSAIEAAGESTVWAHVRIDALPEGEYVLFVTEYSGVYHCLGLIATAD